MCWYCGSPVKETEPFGRSRVCLDCGKDLRSCGNCRHNLPSGCAESQAEKPSDPERANFCDWFSLNPRFREATEGKKKSVKAEAQARQAFDDLFG